MPTIKCMCVFYTLNHLEFPSSFQSINHSLTSIYIKSIVKIYRNNSDTK